MRFRYKVRVVVGVIMAVLGILFTLQNFGRPARVHQLRDNAVSGFYERRFSGGDRRLRDLIDSGPIRGAPGRVAARGESRRHENSGTASQFASG